MFSSLAKYFFGGFVDETPETTPLQYATREVNDWLLVDMPDQAIDNEDLNSEGEEEDEILTALPLLMTQESYICDNSYDEINMTQKEESCPSVLSLPHFIPSECVEGFQILPESMYLNHSIYYPSDFSLVVSQCQCDIHYLATKCQLVLPPIFYRMNPQLKRLDRLMEYTSKKNSIKRSHSIYTAKFCSELISFCDRRVDHPAFSKNFVNHRSPALPPKTALLEQIKELKPVQRAIEHDTKKYLNRSQMNRQNRNYIYESSVKTNRRRHLQRNHSGANNNRKC